MSTVYRKSAVDPPRMFYKIQNMEYVTRVRNKLWMSSIDVCRNPVILSEAMDSINAVATEEEFPIKKLWPGFKWGG